MKQINFSLSFTCTDEQFVQPTTQNLLSDKWKEELIQSAEESGFENVEAKWEFEDLN